MPAFTVPDVTVLPPVPALLPSVIQRPVVSITSAPSAFEGEGFPVKRAFAGVDLKLLDPFIHMDEMGEVDYAPGEPKGTAWHPHRGFETVTYMLAGRMRHADNQGNSGLLTPGSVQWMTAGRGIVHSEMPEQEDGLMWGFQLWVNLPAGDKMNAPRYQDIAPERIPTVEAADGVRVRVLAGRFGDTVGPVSGIAVEPLYLDIELAAAAHCAVKIPAGHNAFAYVYADTAELGPADAAKRIERGELAVLERDGEKLLITAGTETTRLIVVAGKPLNEPVARYGPFVMNTPEQIVETIRDFQAGKF